MSSSTTTPHQAIVKAFCSLYRKAMSAQDMIIFATQKKGIPMPVFVDENVANYYKQVGYEEAMKDVLDVITGSPMTTRMVKFEYEASRRSEPEWP